SSSRVRDPRGRKLTYEGVPGLVERKEAYGETTLVVDPARVVEACTHLRDEEGFNFLSDITAVDYLGWGERHVAGYYGTAVGRDLGPQSAQGFARSPTTRSPERSTTSRSTPCVDGWLGPKLTWRTSSESARLAGTWSSVGIGAGMRDPL